MAITTIPTAGIADTAVSTAKIADNAVTASKAGCNNINFKNYLFKLHLALPINKNSIEFEFDYFKKVDDKFSFVIRYFLDWKIDDR